MVEVVKGLFRDEAISAKRARLEGDVVVRESGFVSYGAYLLPLLAVPFVVSTLFWSYARVQQAPGWLTTTQGLVQVRALRAGTIEKLPVSEGDRVAAGAIVAVVRVEEAQPALGETPEAALLSFVSVQQQRLDKQIDLARQRGVTESARRREQLSALRKELRELDSQLARQAAIVSATWRDVEAAEKLAEKGFSTGREQRNRRALWSEQARDQASLRQQRVALMGRIASSEADLERLPMDLESEIAKLESDRAELAQRAAEIEGRRRYSLVAPIAGRIASLNVRGGYAVDQQRSILTIVPEGAALEAELFLPSSASAFVKAGQDVRLLYDAFPYQRFGAGSGRIVQVSQSSIAAKDAPQPLALNEPVYVVRVALNDPFVVAFGENVALKPGMTLRANVLLEERSIFEWIFEPIYAVRGRT